MEKLTPDEQERIAEHSRTLVAQAALRKVRRTLDRIAADEAARRRLLRQALSFAVAIVAVSAWLLWAFFFSDSARR